MRRAIAVLEQKGQKVGTLRFANLDIKQMVGVSSIDVYSVAEYNAFNTSVAALSSPSGGRGWFGGAKKLTAPPPQPEKITVSATVQCAFQIQQEP